MFKKEEVGSSPLPVASPEIIEGQIEDDEENLFNFYEAIKWLAITTGGKVTKKEWGSKDEYGFLKDEKLCIKLKEGERYWVVSLADIMGEDYLIL